MFRRVAMFNALRTSLRPSLYAALKPNKIARSTSLQNSWARFSSSIGKIDKPTYQLTFTCKKCDDRSSHLISKQAYHNGTVLIQCPSCKSRHLIADHLKIFGDKERTLEDILADKGESVTKTNLDLSKVADLEWEPSEKDGTIKLVEEPPKKD